jgi:hypothetical protein
MSRDPCVGSLRVIPSRARKPALRFMILCDSASPRDSSSAQTVLAAGRRAALAIDSRANYHLRCSRRTAASVRAPAEPMVEG